MKKRSDKSKFKLDFSIVNSALDALDDDELCRFIRDIIPWLDNKTQARVVNDLIERAARSKNKWIPAGPSDKMVEEIVAFSKAAKRVSYADPSIVDEYLMEGENAFLAKDYSKSLQIFRCLLIPIANADIDIGQHEMIDEVLGVEPSDCASQYVVSVYMTTTPDRRVEEVRKAISDMDGAGYFFEPLKEMEKVAVEPFPEFDAFMIGWRNCIEAEINDDRRRNWGTNSDEWLREVVQRLDGVDGLAGIARVSRRAEDLRAWCTELADSRQWNAALSAYKEAAELVTDSSYWKGEFLDGAALSAQELGKKNLASYLETAWNEAPSLLRLRRWLGSSGSKAVLNKRIRKALQECPKKAHRQLGLLNVMSGDFKTAAKLLASASGLGWSDREHPGHLLFPLFRRLLGDDPQKIAFDNRFQDLRGMDLDEHESLDSDRNVPHLLNPTVEELVASAGINSISAKEDRPALLKAMRTAAEKRMAGVTENKRRRYYGHAAALAAACAGIDTSDVSERWLSTLRDKYRRYPALQQEFDR